MTDHDLFAAETAALAEATEVVADAGLDAGQYRVALERLADHYRRLMREARRTIQHADRQERELTRLNAQLKDLAQRLDHKARHDALTGAFNRGAIIELIGSHLGRHAVALIVLDIDHFKRVNDEFGHPAGDAVIVELVARLRAVLADHGDIGRVGGEEFTIVLPRFDLTRAASLAERMRDAVAAIPFPHPVGRTVTASFGVSWNPLGTSFDVAYGGADAMLYEAKRAGRNKVMSHGSTAD
jgi:diguanylate cyclase (GGDEF)-like protein